MMMYTTANVPNEIKRFTRETRSLNDTLFTRWSWSHWVLAMTPEQHDDFKRRKTDEYNRPGYKITKAALKHQFQSAYEKNSCGVYEWMARHTVTNKAYVVYIGSTCKSKSGNFIERIYKYCTDGSHKADLIDNALQKGYELSVRFKGSGDSTGANSHNKASAECDENIVLKYFDYAWNIRSVKQIERSLP